MLTSYASVAQWPRAGVSKTPPSRVQILPEAPIYYMNSLLNFFLT